jgi:hypothetical protein
MNSPLKTESKFGFKTTIKDNFSAEHKAILDEVIKHLPADNTSSAARNIASSKFIDKRDYLIYLFESPEFTLRDIKARILEAIAAKSADYIPQAITGLINSFTESMDVLIMEKEAKAQTVEKTKAQEKVLDNSPPKPQLIPEVKKLIRYVFNTEEILNEALKIIHNDYDETINYKHIPNKFEKERVLFAVLTERTMPEIDELIRRVIEGINHQEVIGDDQYQNVLWPKERREIVQKLLGPDALKELCRRKEKD